jgi:ThiF family
MRVWSRAAGLDVVMMDADQVSETNCVRQPFSASDVGQNKATVLINRINRFWGTRWRAEPTNFGEQTVDRINYTSLDLLIGCVDTRAARSIIARALTKTRNRTVYWLDLSNYSCGRYQMIKQRLNEIARALLREFCAKDSLGDCQAMSEIGDHRDEIIRLQFQSDFRRPQEVRDKLTSVAKLPPMYFNTNGSGCIDTCSGSRKLLKPTPTRRKR